MKIYSKILALCVFHALEASAFTFQAPAKVSPVVLGSTTEAGVDLEPAIAMQRIEGAGTVKTFPIPPDATRIEYIVETEGRPMKASIDMWVGPIRQTHTLKIDSQDGSKNPYRGILKVKPAYQELKISNSGPYEFPMSAGIRIASTERADELIKATDDLWDKVDHTVVQGGGAIRSFPIDTSVDVVQLMFWSRDVGGKGPHAKVEVLQGPNNQRQLINARCSGGSQPYTCLIETPGAGWTLRITNLKELEFPFECAVVPYKAGKGSGDANASDGQWWS